MLKLGFDLGKDIRKDNSLLLYALESAGKSNVAFIRNILEVGADINATHSGYYDRTPIQIFTGNPDFTVVNKKNEILHLLLSQPKINLKYQDCVGNAFLHLLTDKNDFFLENYDTIINTLKEKGDINVLLVKNNKGNTVLDIVKHKLLGLRNRSPLELYLKLEQEQNALLNQ